MVTRWPSTHRQAAAAQDAAAKQYIQQAAGTTPSTADELQRLADLKAQGVISDAEFETGEGEGAQRLSRRECHTPVFHCGA